MALTVSLTYVVTEGATADGYTITLARLDGFVLHQASGATRALALRGLLDYGFSVVDS